MWMYCTFSFMFVFFLWLIDPTVVTLAIRCSHIVGGGVTGTSTSKHVLLIHAQFSPERAGHTALRRSNPPAGRRYQPCCRMLGQENSGDKQEVELCCCCRCCKQSYNSVKLLCVCTLPLFWTQIFSPSTHWEFSHYTLFFSIKR